MDFNPKWWFVQRAVLLQAKAGRNWQETIKFLLFTSCIYVQLSKTSLELQSMKNNADLKVLEFSC